MLTMRQKLIELFVADISVLVLENHANAILLSGDGHLRMAAKKGGIACHGTLWLMDKLVEREILFPHRAAESLQAMCDNNRWLPEEECRQRIRKWGIGNAKK